MARLAVARHALIWIRSTAESGFENSSFMMIEGNFDLFGVSLIDLTFGGIWIPDDLLRKVRKDGRGG
jgi:hypothetical protein